MLPIIQSTMSLSCPRKAENMLREKNREKTEEKARNLYKSENTAFLWGKKNTSMILMTTCNPVLPLYKPFRIGEYKIVTPVVHCELITEKSIVNKTLKCWFFPKWHKQPHYAVTLPKRNQRNLSQAINLWKKEHSKLSGKERIKSELPYSYSR